MAMLNNQRVFDFNKYYLIHNSDFNKKNLVEN